ncbi:MAG: glycosyltransferase family 39 protein [Steroidobacterales bacterium]
MSNARFNRYLAPAAITFTVLWFALLAWRPLYDPDEGRYAEIPREILSGGDWLIPHLNGLVYLEKPPLQYWLAALAFEAFGQSELIARLWTGLFGYLSLWLIFAIARRLWGSEAALKAVTLMAGSILFVLLGHQLTLDMTLSFWLLATLSCFVFAQTEPARSGAARAWMLGCWAAMALAVLTKGLIGVLIPAATLAIYVLWQRDWALLSKLHLRWGLPLFALIVAPWFVLASRANEEFLHFFFIREHFQRFLTPIEERSEPWWFFIPVLVVGILPWVTLGARELATGWRSSVERGRFDAPRLLWIWSVFVLVFFSASNAKLIPYILPALPTIALLCARPHRGDERRHLAAGACLSIAFAIGVLGYASAIWSSANGAVLAIRLRPALIATSAVLVLGALAGLRYAVLRRERCALAALALGWFGAAIAITAGACAVQDLFSARDIAALIRREAPAAVPVFAVQNYQQSLPFYLQRTVILVDYRDEFALGLRQAGAPGIATLDEFAARWLTLDEGLAVMPRATRERLASAGVSMREVACFANRLCLMSRH